MADLITAMRKHIEGAGYSISIENRPLGEVLFMKKGRITAESCRRAYSEEEILYHWLKDLERMEKGFKLTPEEEALNEKYGGR